MSVCWFCHGMLMKLLFVSFSTVVTEARDLIRMMLNPCPKERLVCKLPLGKQVFWFLGFPCCGFTTVRLLPSSVLRWWKLQHNYTSSCKGLQVPDFASLQQLAKQLCRLWLDKQNRKAFDYLYKTSMKTNSCLSTTCQLVRSYSE